MGKHIIWLTSVTCIFAPGVIAQDNARPVFEPTWESLNSRKSPEWFRDAKFGIFIHWGVYSVPAICDTSTYAEWYLNWLKTNSHGGLVRKFHEENYGADFAYTDFASMWRAELWKPDDWAKLFKRAGAKYVVLVSKHHDGFALWPAAKSSEVRGYAWNAAETGPKRDLVGDLTQAVRGEGLKMDFYYSFMEWDNPLYEEDRARYVDEMMVPQIKELVTKYEPAVVWPDGEWNHSDKSWRSEETLAWIYNNCANPDELVVNDRWGKELRGQVGDYYTTEYGNLSGPGMADEGKPFEECRGIGHSFALNRLENYDSYLTQTELVRLLIELVSNGGGLLLNLGPTADGRIPVIQQDRLIALGEWLDANGESIYGTRASRFPRLDWGRSTTKGNTIYLHVLDWPKDHKLAVPGLVTRINRAYLLHDPDADPLPVAGSGGGAPTIDLLGRLPFPHATVVALELDGEPVVDVRIRPDADGVIVLPAESADLSGAIRLETNTAGGETVNNIGYWSDIESVASWEIVVKPNATYSVSLEYACLPGAEGSDFALTLGDQVIEATIDKPTTAWQDYTPLDLGTIRTGADKSLTCTIKATAIPEGRHLMNLRKLILTP